MLFQDGNGTNVTNTTSTNVTTPPSPPWWETFELPWWLRLNWEHLPDIHPATFAMVFIFMCGFYFVFLRKRTIPQWGHGALKGGHDYDSKELGRVDRIVAFIESGGQIGDLDEEEEEEFHRRDFSRSGFRDSGLPTKPATAPVQAGKVNEQALEEREAWVEEHAQAFEEHAQLVGEEEIGSGVVTSDVTAEEGAEYDARVAENGGKQGAVQISLMWDNWNDPRPACVHAQRGADLLQQSNIGVWRRTRHRHEPQPPRANEQSRTSSGPRVLPMASTRCVSTITATTANMRPMTPRTTSYV